MDHKNSYSASYAAAGVDITAGYRAVELMKKHVARTRNEGCLDDVGGFGGCFGLPVAGYEEPVLVSGTDGCGTKVKLAILMDKHDTIGIDAVAMCVNDIICCGAKPLFFLDYIACGKNIPEKIAEIVGGVAEGCVQSGAALIGGETAEHPGLMPVDEYDLAGFTVGFLELSYTHGLPYTRAAAIAVNIFELITVAVQMSLYCWAIRILRHILGPMTRGKPFAKTIWADLRKLGWVSLGLCLMDNIMDLGIVLIYEYAYPVRELLESGNIQSVHFRYHFEPAFAIIAAVLFLLSHIFHYGSQLQQLSDETL